MMVEVEVVAWEYKRVDRVDHRGLGVEAVDCEYMGVETADHK